MSDTPAYIALAVSSAAFALGVMNFVTQTSLARRNLRLNLWDKRYSVLQDVVRATKQAHAELMSEDGAPVACSSSKAGDVLSNCIDRARLLFGPEMDASIRKYRRCLELHERAVRAADSDRSEENVEDVRDYYSELMMRERSIFSAMESYLDFTEVKAEAEDFSFARIVRSVKANRRALENDGSLSWRPRKS